MEPGVTSGVNEVASSAEACLGLACVVLFWNSKLIASATLSEADPSEQVQ